MRTETKCTKNEYKNVIATKEHALIKLFLQNYRLSQTNLRQAITDLALRPTRNILEKYQKQ